MPQHANQILSVREMRAAEDALIAQGVSVDQLMLHAGRGAADYIWRMAAHRKVTVLCGPGNNGGDGYVIAEALRARGGQVCVVAVVAPATDAARAARMLYQGTLADAEAQGDVLVDCLFGSGLSRPLPDDLAALLSRLAASHRQRIAVDIPSGVEADTGALLNDSLPRYDLTIALGAWKYAHFMMPACAMMGDLKLVDIGVDAVPDAVQVVSRPKIAPPTADAHKYRRGMLGVIGGAVMPGAAVLSATAAQVAGAGYVKLLGDAPAGQVPPHLVVDSAQLADALTDRRFNALMIGPGLGRGAEARRRLVTMLTAPVPGVIDADGLIILSPVLLAQRKVPLIATPHEGEMADMERVFKLRPELTKPQRAFALANATRMIIVAKGPDTVIAAPDGRLAFASRASSWLSVAGTGDVLAGIIASRLATGADPFAAACEGVWLHSEAARLCGPTFTASELAQQVRSAYAACQ
jgi:ADP-dependent NAD(P)H-hydrate dehydratase / NAD(P)H-hydrate epimerase